MSFTPGTGSRFLELFVSKSGQIRDFPGCLGVELHRLSGDDEVFFTISQWDCESSLETYRNSELFKETWRSVKPLFSVKAEAWTLERPDSSGFAKKVF
jgi:heme-degrading monooxygenase HmoA